ncbi:MAG TPA: energy transducer TonB [Gemmatimonadales bacterium]|nr:energy transducer TonB [Gemmatimonadales bacterium]
MDYAQQQRSWGKHLPSITLVVLLHIALGYALVTGLARRVVEVIKQPIETKIIEEIKKPPPDVPPPPPPKLAAPPPPFIPPPEINIQVPQVQTQPTITTVTTVKPPPGPPVMAPPAPAPPKPAGPPVRKEFKAAYRVEPQFPRQALRDGMGGRVVAHVYVEPNGAVSDVKIISSTNRIFDREVIRALSQWKFNPEPVGFIGEYEIVFNLKD